MKEQLPFQDWRSNTSLRLEFTKFLRFTWSSTKQMPLPRRILETGYQSLRSPLDPKFMRHRYGNEVLKLKHAEVLRKIESLGRPALVLEDDAMPGAEIQKQISNAINCSASNPGFINLTTSIPLETLGISKIADLSPHFSLGSIPSTNTTCAYIVDPQSAGLLSRGLKYMDGVPVDHRINNLLRQHGIVAYHPSGEPPILHGSILKGSSSLRG